MNTYNLPILAQYVLNVDRYHYRDRQQWCDTYNACGITLALNARYLDQLIFSRPRRLADDPSDFLSQQRIVEAYQIKILLGQVAQRQGISYVMRSYLDDRDLAIRTELDQLEDIRLDAVGSPARLSLEKRLDDVEKERNMEAVSLWRDTQKVLTELFRHWSNYTNVARRSEVMSDGV